MYFSVLFRLDPVVVVGCCYDNGYCCWDCFVG